ncbi:hypothetical protein [Hydrogenovibrio kuenenii]|uniref:hypothetical protein n=1 Tax=Hydrogenovibrio kuenenii TaxID=63658 RepID=UPI0004639992|nr:hypothetical protein [Hydrogenovibrio kuenenii]
MNAKKAKFTWHYYFMAFGALMALLAVTLSAWGATISALAFTILSHPVIRFAGVGRFVFLILFAILYVFSFPDPAVVKSMMASDVAHS